MEELGARPELIGLLAALFAGTQMVSMIPAGIASDRWGPRPLLLGGWFVAIVSTAIMALAPNLFFFAVGYAGYGLTFGVLPPLSSAITHARGRWTPERAFTRVYSFFGTGFIISPIVGGLIGEEYGLRSGYLLALVLISISAGIMTRIGSGGSHLVHDRTSPMALVRRRSYQTFLGLVCIIAFSTWLGIPLAVNYLQDRWTTSVSNVGLLNSVSSIGGVALALFLGGKPPRRVLILLQVAVAIYLAIILRTGQLGWLALAFILQAGARLKGQFLDAISARVVEQSQFGLAFALNRTTTQAAAVVASALAGYLYAVRPSLPFQLGLGLIPLVATFAWWKLPRAQDDSKSVADSLAIHTNLPGED
jgi:DHA1 family tetracycline resistance protein-like MFS transporter